MRPKPFPNEFRTYPLTIDSTYQINDTLSFPKEFIWDAHIYTTKNEPYEITRIQKKDEHITFIIGTVFDREQIYGEYTLTPMEKDVEGITIDLFDFDYGRRAGVILAQTADTFLFFPDGNFELDNGAVRFEVSCYVPMPTRSLEGLNVNGKLVTGDIAFQGTPGVILECDDSENEITVNFTGEPYYSDWKQSPKKIMSYVRSLTVRSICDSDSTKNTSVELVPDGNGNIPIYVSHKDLANALRILGKLNVLEIKLAR